MEILIVIVGAFVGGFFGAYLGCHWYKQTPVPVERVIKKVKAAAKAPERNEVDVLKPYADWMFHPPKKGLLE